MIHRDKENFSSKTNDVKAVDCKKRKEKIIIIINNNNKKDVQMENSLTFITISLTVYPN